MPNLKKIVSYLFVFPIITAFLITLFFKEYLVINIYKDEFSLSFLTYLALFLISGLSAIIIPSKNRVKGSLSISLNHKELLIRTLLINVPLVIIFIFILFTQNTNPSLFCVLHLILFNAAYTILIIFYYRYVKKKGTFFEEFNSKLDEFTSNNPSSIERGDFIINTLNNEIVHLNDAYAIMRLESYTQLFEYNLNKFFEYQKVISSKFINEAFEGRIAFQADQILIKYLQESDNPEYDKTVEIEEWMNTNYFDPATLIIRYFEKEANERIEYVQTLEEDALILGDNPKYINLSKTIEIITKYLLDEK